MPPLPRLQRLAATGALTLLLTSCAAVPTVPPPVPAAHELSVSDRLYFGRSIPGGGEVSEADWEAFLQEVVAPRFPQGFTVWRAEGQWLGADGQVMWERTYVLEVIRPAAGPTSEAVAEIAEAYRLRFRQEAVLRVQTPVRADF